MLVEKLKQECNQIGWKFNYGQSHWQNLQDIADDAHLPFEQRQKHLLLLWKDRDFIINEYGAITGYTYAGEAVLCVRSKLSDKDYNQKYEDHIKSLEAEVNKLFEQFTSCEDWEIKRWKEIEVENQYDTNLDGLKISFTIQVTL